MKRSFYYWRTLLSECLRELEWADRDIEEFLSSEVNFVTLSPLTLVDGIAWITSMLDRSKSWRSGPRRQVMIRGDLVELRDDAAHYFPRTSIQKVVATTPTQRDTVALRDATSSKRCYWSQAFFRVVSDPFVAGGADFPDRHGQF